MHLSNRKPLRVLTAVSHDALPLLTTALGLDFFFVFCDSMASAKAALNEPIDVVLASINFDDGRIFDLLRLCKSIDHAKRIPFVCVKILENEVDGAAQEAVDIASRSLGGDGFIDLYRWTRRFGVDQSYEEFRNLIDTLAQFRRAQDQYNPALSLT